MTAGRHHISRKVVYKIKAYDTGTARMVSYNRSVVTKPKPNPVARYTLGAIAALVIAVTVLGEVTPADPPEEPSVVVSVAVPVPITARPVEPVVAPVVRKRLVRNRPAVRVAPAPVEPVKKQVKHKKQVKP